MLVLCVLYVIISDTLHHDGMINAIAVNFVYYNLESGLRGRLRICQT